jgi:phosphoribosylanthranilate isomerase
MIVQIYEVSSPDEAAALSDLGVDHIGVLVGDGSFAREQSIDQAKEILSAITPPAKGSALSLSADLGLIRRIVLSLNPAILHLGASSDVLSPDNVRQIRNEFPDLIIMRSIPLQDRRV